MAARRLGGRRAMPIALLCSGSVESVLRPMGAVASHCDRGDHLIHAVF